MYESLKHADQAVLVFLQQFHGDFATSSENAVDSRGTEGVHQVWSQSEGDLLRHVESPTL